ncbi:MAG: TIGR03790 family protein [Bryobacteraceae bacterium]
MIGRFACLVFCILPGSAVLTWNATAQTGAQVLLVGNRDSAESRQIVEYYRSRRSIPAANVCWLSTTTDEEVSWNVYQSRIEGPVGDCLKNASLQEKVLYIVLTLGTPLKIDGTKGQMATRSSVDSELALLYSKLKGAKFDRAGPLRNPFFSARDAPFRHPQFPIYLVTRLAGYDVDDVKRMIDHALTARNTGVFVIDAPSAGGSDGNGWLRAASLLLPPSRVKLDLTPRVLYGEKNVIGYASWGSNDPNRKQRWLHYEWLPGAIATDFVSTNARTFKRPPGDWNISSGKSFGDSEQSLSADSIHEGASGASGNVYEPYLTACARPEYLLPAYYDGRNLAESFYMALPYLSWMGIVLGDPLCSLGKP